MANKYHVTSLDNFELDTESQTYQVSVEVDSLDYITLEFGDSFSLRFNYNQAEKIEAALKTARYLIQDQNIDSAHRSIDNSDNTVTRWNPNDPRNW